MCVRHMFNKVLTYLLTYLLIDYGRPHKGGEETPTRPVNFTHLYRRTKLNNLLVLTGRR